MSTETGQTFGQTENRGLASFKAAFDSLSSERPGILASESGGELSWLKKARERDAELWLEAGIPTRKDERWKYTNVSILNDSEILLQKKPKALPAREKFPILVGEKTAEITFLNGHYIPEWSRYPADASFSVVVLSETLEDAVNKGWTDERRARFKLFREHVESSDADTENVFAAMNTSFLQDGVLISIKASTLHATPIVVNYFTDVSDANEKLEMISPRLFMHIDRAAQASLVEVYAGEGDRRYLSNSVSDIRVEEGARLTYAKVQVEGSSALHIGTTRIRQKRDSFSENYQFSFGSRIAREDLRISLEGTGAEAILDGLYMVQGKQHVDHHTSVEHVVPHTTSNQVYKGILDDESRAVFNGHVAIYRDAQKSNAAQLNNNLIMSPKAEIDTKPELEIDADDVKAAHGAAIGQIDPDHVFYLQARAISKDEAVRMLARGFAKEIVFRIHDADIREKMSALVDSRFEQMKIAQSGNQKDAGL